MLLWHVTSSWVISQIDWIFGPWYLREEGVNWPGGISIPTTVHSMLGRRTHFLVRFTLIISLGAWRIDLDALASMTRQMNGGVRLHGNRGLRTRDTWEYTRAKVAGKHQRRLAKLVMRLLWRIAASLSPRVWLLIKPDIHSGGRLWTSQASTLGHSPSWSREKVVSIDTFTTEIDAYPR